MISYRVKKGLRDCNENPFAFVWEPRELVNFVRNLASSVVSSSSRLINHRPDTSEQKLFIMNDNVFVVIVDTRAMYPSDIDGYEEHTYSREEFDKHVLLKPTVKCMKSKVAELCGVNMKLYFHDYVRNRPRRFDDPPEFAITCEKEDLCPSKMVNGAASLLTFDPRTGFPDYIIVGEAFCVVDSGDYPLSSHQVWGIQDLISEARDLYYCDPEHLQRGRRQLVRWCFEYRNQDWGPLTIYKPRVEMAHKSLPDDEVQTFKLLNESVKAQQHIKEVHDYYNHRHFPDCKCTKCSQLRYDRDHRGANPAPTPQKEKREKRRRWERFPFENVMCNFK